MNSIQLRYINTGIFFLFIFLSGFWLNRSGSPYGTFGLTVHKLIALGALAFLAVFFYRRNQATPLSTAEIIAITCTVLLFIGTIGSGGLLSMGKTMPAIVSQLHLITPFLTVGASVITLYLLLGNL